MKKEKVVKIDTFFSGIGSPEKALERLKKENIISDYEIMFFSEIEKNAIKSYCAIHNIDESLNVGNILDIQGKNLKYCDLWGGGFPCQDISCAGKMQGFNFNSSTRSSLGWEMIRLLREIKEKPKYVIFENVMMITSKRFKDTLALFKQDLGYTLYDDILSADDYGIPQTRKRYFLIAILNKSENFNFPNKINLEMNIKNILETEVDEKYYLTNDDYESNGNKRIFENKKRRDIKYEIDMDKFHSGGVCGVDKHSKFAQSARLFSENGLAPTITACNTADSAKIVVEEGRK